MSLRSRLKQDLQKLSKLGVHLPKGANTMLNQFNKQLGDYENKVRSFVHGMDLKGQEARSKSRKYLNNLLSQIKKTRATMEDRLTDTLQQEGKRLNGRVNELLKFLVATSKAEKGSTTGATKRAKRPAPKARQKKKAGAKRHS